MPRRRRRRLRVDANGVWAPDEAVLKLGAMERFALELAEQPAAGLEELALVRAAHRDSGRRRRERVEPGGGRAGRRARRLRARDGEALQGRRVRRSASRCLAASRLPVQRARWAVRDRRRGFTWRWPSGPVTPAWLTALPPGSSSSLRSRASSPRSGTDSSILPDGPGLGVDPRRSRPGTGPALSAGRSRTWTAPTAIPPSPQPSSRSSPERSRTRRPLPRLALHAPRAGTRPGARDRDRRRGRRALGRVPRPRSRAGERAGQSPSSPRPARRRPTSIPRSSRQTSPASRCSPSPPTARRSSAASGAGQTIDQIKLYGAPFAGSARSEPTMPTTPASSTCARPPAGPSRSPAPRARDPSTSTSPGATRSDPSRATATSPRAPPWPSRAGMSVPLTASASPPPPVAGVLVEMLGEHLQTQPPGPDRLRPAARSRAWPAPIADLAAATGFPILAEPTSQLRFGGHDRSLVISALRRHRAHETRRARPGADPALRRDADQQGPAPVAGSRCPIADQLVVDAAVGVERAHPSGSRDGSRRPGRLAAALAASVRGGHGQRLGGSLARRRRDGPRTRPRRCSRRRASASPPSTGRWRALRRRRARLHRLVDAHPRPGGVPGPGARASALPLQPGRQRHRRHDLVRRRRRDRAAAADLDRARRPRAPSRLQRARRDRATPRSRSASSSSTTTAAASSSSAPGRAARPRRVRGALRATPLGFEPERYAAAYGVPSPAFEAWRARRAADAGTVLVEARSTARQVALRTLRSRHRAKALQWSSGPRSLLDEALRPFTLRRPRRSDRRCSGSIASSFSSVSASSAAGSESATMPAPAIEVRGAVAQQCARRATQNSPSSSASIQPTGPAYQPRSKLLELGDRPRAPSPRARRRRPESGAASRPARSPSGLGELGVDRRREVLDVRDLDHLGLRAASTHTAMPASARRSACRRSRALSGSSRAQELLAEMVVDGRIGAPPRRAGQRHRGDAGAVRRTSSSGLAPRNAASGVPHAKAETGGELLAHGAEDGAARSCADGASPHLAGEHDLLNLPASIRATAAPRHARSAGRQDARDRRPPRWVRVRHWQQIRAQSREASPGGVDGALAGKRSNRQSVLLSPPDERKLRDERHRRLEGRPLRRPGAVRVEGEAPHPYRPRARLQLIWLVGEAVAHDLRGDPGTSSNRFGPRDTASAAVPTPARAKPSRSGCSQQNQRSSARREAKTAAEGSVISTGT